VATNAANSTLEAIRVDRIEPNPDNPRLVFRAGELAELLESIRVFGIQVPISVYRKGNRFILIDGERRWKCALKLNFKTIPALIQEEPSPLDNLLLMFNIHALREQWDLLTIAMKLPSIIKLIESETNAPSTERQLSERTGLTRGIIRRCKLLMDVPERYKRRILEELRKPKGEQRFTEDLLIELERALKTVERAMPDVIPDKETVRRVLLEKYSTGVIKSRVDFRKVGKIARAKHVGSDTGVASKALLRLFQVNTYSIDAAFSGSVGAAYKERDIGHRIDALIELLDEIENEELEPEVRDKLGELLERLSELLNSAP
jgi:ParB/RepB/Spo0J family partition protein